jgi:hypothetical protein
MTRLQFFIDHIGKPVFRQRNGCKGNKGKPCSICEHNYQNGLLIEDELHASYLVEIERELKCTYYDSREERDRAEQSKIK